MDEKTARTRWCPMVRITTETERWKAMNNREQVLVGDKNRSNCIASDCMMWRIGCAEHLNPSLHIGEGYCGLAGKS